MDPNANLQEQFRISKRAIDGHPLPTDLERLAELVLALNEWLQSGGFLPSLWRNAGRG